MPYSCFSSFDAKVSKDTPRTLAIPAIVWKVGFFDSPDSIFTIVNNGDGSIYLWIQILVLMFSNKTPALDSPGQGIDFCAPGVAGAPEFIFDLPPADLIFADVRWPQKSNQSAGDNFCYSAPPWFEICHVLTTSNFKSKQGVQISLLVNHQRNLGSLSHEPRGNPSLYTGIYYSEIADRNKKILAIGEVIPRVICPSTRFARSGQWWASKKPLTRLFARRTMSEMSGLFCLRIA